MGNSTKQVKIIPISYYGGKDTEKDEKTIAGLVSSGWRIMAAGGGNYNGNPNGFIVLQKDLKVEEIGIG